MHVLYPADMSRTEWVKVDRRSPRPDVVDCESLRPSDVVEGRARVRFSSFLAPECQAACERVRLLGCPDLLAYGRKVAADVRVPGEVVGIEGLRATTAVLTVSGHWDEEVFVASPDRSASPPTLDDLVLEGATFELFKSGRRSSVYVDGRCPDGPARRRCLRVAAR